MNHRDHPGLTAIALMGGNHLYSVLVAGEDIGFRKELAPIPFKGRKESLATREPFFAGRNTRREDKPVNDAAREDRVRVQKPSLAARTRFTFMGHARSKTPGAISFALMYAVCIISNFASIWSQ